MTPPLRLVIPPLLAACWITAAPLTAQTVPLPPEAEGLLKQLEEFETKTRAEAEAAIAEKRRLVAKALEPHQERETKAGQLDTAVWLKSKIAELNGTPGAPVNPADLAGTAWKNGSWTYRFLDNGAVTVSAPTGENRYRWTQAGENVTITAADGKEFATWRVSRAGDTARVTSGTGDGMEPKKLTTP